MNKTIEGALKIGGLVGLYSVSNLGVDYLRERFDLDFLDKEAFEVRGIDVELDDIFAFAPFLFFLWALRK